jgi:menaquinone-9 beta-reductase
VADSFDAIVIGGGPAGSTTALLLARAGWSVAVVERMVFPRRKVCGEFLSAANLPLLRHLGVADAFLELAGPEVKRVGLFARHRRIIARMPQLENERHGWGRALGRDHLDGLLLARAAEAGAQIFQPWSVSAVSPSSVRIVGGPARTERALAARVIVAAHGSWDAGQLPTQPERRRQRDSDLFGFKAHFLGSSLPADLMPLLAFPGGYGGLVHSDHDRVSLSCCVRRDQLESCRELDSSKSAGEAVLTHIVSTCAGAREALDGATRESEWRSSGPIRPGIRHTDREGIVFAGNAAGEAHPVVAEGIGMAMQSGFALAQALTTAPSFQEACRRYQAAWHRLFGPRIRAAAVIAHWAMRPAAVAVTLPVLAAFPAMLTEGARTSGKVMCSPSF